MFSYVFLTSHLEIVEITQCLEGFRHARAAAAAMCTLPYFLQGILEIWLWKNTKMSFYIVFCKGKQATTKQPDLDHIAITVKKQGASIGRSSSIEKKHMMKGGPCTRGPNNNISLETITFNNKNPHRGIPIQPRTRGQ